jgi:cell wall-associated NlpC family hydrolase
VNTSPTAIAAGGVGGILGVILLVIVALGGGGASSSQETEDSALTGGLLPGAPLNASAVPNQAWVAWIRKAGALCATFPAPVIAAQIDDESGWDPTTVSPMGAEGLAQFLPSTFAAYSQDDAGDGDVSPFNPPDAIMAQGRYDCALAAAVAGLAQATGLSVLTEALYAYNEGLGALEADGGVAKNSQTQAYAPKIEALVAQYTAPSAVLTAAGSTFGEAVLTAAAAEIGLPYVWGGGSDIGPTEGGFDCSGLVLYAVYQASNGTIALPHLSEAQVTLGQSIGTGTGAQVLASGLLEPGDAIGFFNLDDDNAWDHIGIYAGNDEMVVAPHTGANVEVENLNTSYWLATQWNVRRFG